MLNNMKLGKILAAVALTVAVSAPMQAQSLLNRVKSSVEGSVKREISKGAHNAVDNAAKNIGDKIKYRKTENNGTRYYVSKSGSNKNDGKSAETAFKDLQKAIDTAKDGDIIMVAEGNYTGTLDQGFIDINKYVTIIGGFSSDFSDRDPFAYKSYIRPGVKHADSNGTKALFEIDARNMPNRAVEIDGFGFDLGEENKYAAPKPESDRNGCPEGCISGRIQEIGGGLGADGTIGGLCMSHALIHANVNGRLVIRNCVFANGCYYAIQALNYGGDWEISNNVFVSNVYAACQVDGAVKEANKAYVDFHNNTVLFTWCRTKEMEDMGLAFRFMSYVDADVYSNIFGGSNLGALEMTHHASDKAQDARRKTHVKDNQFFANAADLILPSASYKWLKISADQFDEVENFTSESGDAALTDKAFLEKINPAYLMGWLNLEVSGSDTYDENSLANTYRAAHGMNKQGTTIRRVSMYGNKYPFFEAYDLFGALEGCGAQYDF